MINKKLIYLEQVRDHIESLGYDVEKPDIVFDSLTVWGKLKNRKCYVEIYLNAFEEIDNGLYGIWGQGDNEDEELFISNDPNYGLDLRFFPLHILDDLKPLRRI